MEKMKMGILGSGGIAHTMANTVKQMADVELYAVGARTLERPRALLKNLECRRPMVPTKSWQQIRSWISSMWQHPILTIIPM